MVSTYLPYLSILPRYLKVRYLPTYLPYLGRYLRYSKVETKGTVPY